MRISITGFRGELGSFLKTYFSKKFEVSTSLEDFSECDVLMHALSKHPVHTNSEILYSNITFSKKILRRFWHENKSRRKLVILFSTVSFYDPKVKYHNEEAPIVIDNLYKMTKIWLENYIKSVFTDYANLRLPGILEEKNSRSLLPKIFDKLYRNENIQITSNRKFNYFVSKETVCHFCEKVIEKYTFNKRVNLTANVYDNGNESLDEIVYLLKEMLGSKGQIKVNKDNEGRGNILVTDYHELLPVKRHLDQNLHSWVERRLKHYAFPR